MSRVARKAFQVETKLVAKARLIFDWVPTLVKAPLWLESVPGRNRSGL